MITAPTGRLIPTLDPGSPEWLSRMSASKIAAVLGISPYESAFSLWHRMGGLTPPQEQTDVMSRGHYLEPSIRAWFADQHPDWSVTTTGTWVHHELDWAATSPDGLVTTDVGEVRYVEAKTAADSEGWGVAGSDQVPVGYRAQIIWGMHVTGLRVCHLPVLLPFLEFREYVINYDEDDARYMVERAMEFMDSLPGQPRERRPSIDDHSATYQVVRELHPEINAADYDVPLDLAREFCQATTARKEADKAESKARARLADAMGDHKRAMWLDKPIASRQVRGNGVPFLKASNTLPAFDKEEATAA